MDINIFILVGFLCIVFIFPGYDMVFISYLSDLSIANVEKQVLIDQIVKYLREEIPSLGIVTREALISGCNSVGYKFQKALRFELYSHAGDSGCIPTYET